MVNVQVNSQGQVYTDNNGLALVAQEGGSTKYGMTIDTFVGDIDENGVLQQPQLEDLVIDTIRDVGLSAFHSKFRLNLHLSSVSLPNLTTVSGGSGCNSMFTGCSNLTSVSFPSLTTISGSNGCYSMFQSCSNLTSLPIPNLTTISGNYGCSFMFQSCSNLTSVSFPSLTTISGSNGCYSMFLICQKVTNIYFNALTTSSFGTYTNQFNNMLSSTGTIVTHTIHFPSNLESTISGLDGYPLFGGTSGSVVLAFDLPATE